MHGNACVYFGEAGIFIVELHYQGIVEYVTDVKFRKSKAKIPQTWYFPIIQAPYLCAIKYNRE